MKKCLEKIFFQWNILSLIMILAATEALVMAIEGHFYDDTLLIYMLPLFLWRIRGSIKNIALTGKRMGIAIGMGIIGGSAFYIGIGKINSLGAGNSIAKAIIIIAGVSIVSLYLYLFWCENICKWLERKSLYSILGVVMCLMIIPGMQIQKEISVWSITGWLTAAICFTAYMTEMQEVKRKRVLLLIFSFVSACCMTLGNLLHISSSFDSIGKIVLLGIAVGIIGWYPIWRSFAGILYQVCRDSAELISGDSKRKPRYGFLIYMILFIIAWLPYFLAFYPGILSSDSISQVQQVIGEMPSSNHHPWIHTQLIGVCYRIGYAIGGTANSGVAVYSIISMLLLAAAFAKICTWLYCAGIPRITRILSIIFLALCPFNGIYSITMWKDIPFAAFIILFMVNILDITIDYLDKKSVMMHWVEFVVYGILVCVFRSNGIYVWVFTIPFLIGYFFKARKRIIILSLVVLGVVMGYKSILLPSLNVIQPDTIESLSIPVQQVACVIAKDGRIPEQAMKELEQVVDTSKVPETYHSHTSDPMKRLIRTDGNMDYIRERGLEFLQIYAEIGLRNPYYYAEAFIEQTKGYWYHKENDWIYHESFITENQIDIYRDGKLPEGIVTGMEKMLKLSLNGFHAICSLALFTYTLLFCIMAAAINRKQIAVYMPLLGVILTLLIATPRYGDFRYVYPLFAALPLYLGSMIYSFQKEGQVKGE